MFICTFPPTRNENEGSDWRHNNSSLKVNLSLLLSIKILDFVHPVLNLRGYVKDIGQVSTSGNGMWHGCT